MENTTLKVKDEMGIYILPLGKYRCDNVEIVDSDTIYFGSGHEPENSWKFNTAKFSISFFKKNNYSDEYMEFTPTGDYQRFKLSALLYARIFGDTDEELNSTMLKEFKYKFGPGGVNGHASSFIKLEKGKSSYEKWQNLFKDYEEHIWGENGNS